MTWVAVFTMLAGGVAHAGALDANLVASLGTLPSGQKIAVIVYMAAQTDLSAATAGIPAENRAGRGRAVVQALQATAAATQGSLINFLEMEQAAGRVESFTPFWIFNGFAVRATAEAVGALANHPSVALVSEDQTIQLPPPLPGQEEPRIDAAEYGITKIKATKVWSTFGNRGEGRVMGSIDTGFDPTHPDLAPRWRGGTSGWKDTIAGKPTPYDDNGHGSHTIGTAIGGSAGGSDIGVAPNAKFIACKGLDAAGSGSASSLLACMQFMLDPDGNPATPDFPDVVNNSWGTGPGCFRDFQAAVQAWVAAGIFPSFAAGNSGPGSMTGGSPGVYEESFAVGATDINDQIASFSSRGPSSCDGTIFPEVTAPGVNVRSSVPTGGCALCDSSGYRSLNGTSMATPHVTGCTLLMRSAKPTLPVGKIRKFLKKTAKDLAAPGPDNDYGKGRINCFKAVQKAMGAP